MSARSQGVTLARAPSADVRVPTAHHALHDGRVELLGAVDCVTGAMTRVDLPGGRVLVDCGMPQGADAAGWALPDRARGVDAVILTHAHQDHVGALPALIEGGFAGPIVATSPTLGIARLVLDDGLRLTGVGGSDRARLLEAFDRQSRAVPYDAGGAHVAGLEASVTFREAGHILGSASVELVSRHSRLV